MKPLFSYLKTSMMTFGVIAGLSAPSLAGPASMANTVTPMPNAASAMPDVIKVLDPAAGNRSEGNRSGNWQYKRKFYGDGNWSGNRQWRHNGNWNNNWDNDNWRWRNRHHHRSFRSGSGLYLGLGLGLGAPYLYDNYYYQPRYQQRRIYRTQSVSSAHVQWCYNRYRSYRAWDNSFQPYNGPRQLCYSPYS